MGGMGGLNYDECGVSMAVWRQVGVQTTTKIDNDFGMWKFNVGIFNGSKVHGIDPNNFSEDKNDAKDVLLGVDLMKPIPASKIHVGVNAWLGNLLMSEADDIATTIFGGVLEYLGDQIEVGGEFLMRTTESGVEGVDDVSSMGFYGQAKYMFNPEWAVLGRYDNVDPNTDVDDDAETWITLGVNHYINSWHAMIYLNYIMKMEQNDWGADEAFDNDLIVLQFQVAP